MLTTVTLICHCGEPLALVSLCPERSEGEAKGKRSNLKVFARTPEEIASSQAPRNDNVPGGNLPLSNYNIIIIFIFYKLNVSYIIFYMLIIVNIEIKSDGSIFIWYIP